MASKLAALGRLGLILTWWVWASPVEATPTPAERETARSLMLEGDKLRVAGDLKEALSRFQSAHALMGVPTTGLAVAETQAQLGLLVDARSTALEVLSIEAAATEPAVFAAAREKLATLTQSLEKRVCTLRTGVSPESADYKLQIDNVNLPRAARGAPFKTNPGAHIIKVRAPGYREQTRELTLREGAVAELHFTLAAEAEVKRAPAQAPPAAVSPGQAAYSYQLDEARQSGRTRGLIGLSLGAVSLTAGAVTGWLSWSMTAHELEVCRPDYSCDRSQADALRQANTLGHIANITVPLGIIGIGYGLYELLTLPAAPPAAAQAKVELELLPNAILLHGVM